MRSKAVFLVSGGLDSLLAAAVMKDLIEEGVFLHFSNPFAAGDSKEKLVRHTADKLGFPVRIISFGEDFLEIVKNPRFGYGRNINPCIDCRIYQFRKALDVMKEEGAGFIVTGEVVGQRPMSQNLRTMKLIDRESGAAGLVLRPLSARVMEPTLPEIKGIVTRERLLAISGRSRKRQIELAAALGIDRYEAPAGGCLLTIKEYSDKLRDIMEHSGEICFDDIRLLKLGRHFRISSEFKVVVGRNEAENSLLEEIAVDTPVMLRPVVNKGPLCLGTGAPGQNDILTMARICGRYTDSREGEKIRFFYYNFPETGEVHAVAFSHGETIDYRI